LLTPGGPAGGGIIVSAWIVSKPHIDLLVSAGLEFPNHGPLRWNTNQDGEPWMAAELRRETATSVGQMLWLECFRSVDARYPGEAPHELPGPVDFDGESIPTYQHSGIPGLLDPVVVLKQISCYEYQACEHNGWKTSEARRFCMALRDACIGRLSGYEAAPWGFDDAEHFVKAARV
jgi:hypothetical protein